MAVIHTFSVWDYVVFGAVLLVSASIGIYYGCTGSKQSTTREFLMADRSMHVLPVTLSMLASFMSAIMLLGTPAEIYTFGLEYTCIAFGYLVLMPIAAYVYIPVFYELRLTSAYEYLEIRFKHKAVRLLGSFTFILQMTMYMAIVLYAPALALNAVTGFNLWASVISVGAICTFYTSLGGMKAVMWTDVFQVCMMLLGLIAVIVTGSINQNGFSNVWAIAERGGRVNFLDFDPNPGERHTFWSLVFGGLFTWLAIYAVNQSQVQRALTCPNLKSAQLAMMLNGPGLVILMILTSLCGLIIYAHFLTCDPITNKDILARDQLLPFYVMDAMHHLKGVPGLFIACIFSGALSTVSSGLNSLAAVTLEDFVKGYFRPDITEKSATILSKVMAMGYGVVMILLTVVASQLGGVLQAALGLFGMIGGPLLGVFTLAMFFPWANWKGALVGMLTGFCFQFWVGIGAMVYRPITPFLPMSTAGCSHANFSIPEDISLINSTKTANYTHLDGYQYHETDEAGNSTLHSEYTDRPAIAALYSLSYLWYSLVAVLVVCSIGLLVSLATGLSDPEDVDERTIIPGFRYVFWWAPEDTKDRFNPRKPQHPGQSEGETPLEETKVLPADLSTRTDMSRDTTESCLLNAT